MKEFQHSKGEILEAAIAVTFDNGILLVFLSKVLVSYSEMER